MLHSSVFLNGVAPFAVGNFSSIILFTLGVLIRITLQSF